MRFGDCMKGQLDMQIQITTLCENTAELGFIAEWGLSVLVEADGHRILVDTGLNISALHNAHVLGIDLSTIDKIVLSHSHADHTGGLRDVIAQTGKVEVIGHPDIWGPTYSRRQGQKARYIGIPFSRQALEGLGATFILERGPVRISNRIMTTGEIPMTTDFEVIDDNLFVQENGTLVPDTLDDDQALVINADYGLVVVLGCGHRGIVNTLRRAKEITGNDTVYAAIGGTHLLRASDERLDRTIEELQKMGIQKLGVSHCTGFHASARLAQAFGETFFLNNAGNRLTLPQ